MNGAPFVHRFEPGAEDPPRRTVLLLHGTGGNENDLVPLGATLAPGAALLSPRGQVLEAGMPRFFRRLREGVFDIPDFKARAAELGNFVDWAKLHYRLEQTRLIALGFSNGANMASGLALLRPDLLQDLVLLRPMFPFMPEAPPDLQRLRVLMAFGTRDPTVPPDDPARLEQLLTGLGATVTVQRSEAGHGLVPDDYRAVASWLAGSNDVTS